MLGAAAAIFGLDRWTEAHWRELERQVGRDRPAQVGIEPAPASKPAQAPRPPTRQGWLPDCRDDWIGTGRLGSGWDR